MMILEFLGFLRMSFMDVLDIIVVALIIYSLYKILKGSSAMNIFFAIILLMVVRVVAASLNMKMLSSLLGTLLDVGAIALVVIFQPEIRHFLSKMGRGGFRKRNAWLGKLLNKKEDHLENEEIREIVEACREMSEEKTGALIVFKRSDSLNSIIETGDRIDADIRKPLIENIFFKNSPLHDGAMIISNERIVAARCTLPNTTKDNLPSHYGMRHKAAVGMTETSDADVVVVSEQTGHISFVHDGAIRTVDINELASLIKGESTEEKK